MGYLSVININRSSFTTILIWTQNVTYICLSDSGQLEKQLEDVSLARRDLEDSSKYIKTLEKQMKSMTQERDDMHKVETVLPLCISLFKNQCFCSYSLYSNTTKMTQSDKMQLWSFWSWGMSLLQSYLLGLCCGQDLTDANEKMKGQSKDLKEAHSQRKLAMQEFSELNERLTDLR